LLSPAASPPAGISTACLWEDLYPRASASQQQHLLHLAAEQGVLYAHQLVSLSTGAAAATDLSGLLNGTVRDLQPFSCPDLESAADLDPAQREAVARALHTPDVCLIQGLPGTGKSLVAARIVVEAAARGERILVLAPTAAALDRILEQLGGDDSICAVRCCGPEERPETLDLCIRRLTCADRQRFFEEHTLTAARQAVESTQARHAAHRADEAVWQRLDELTTQQHHVAARRRALLDTRSGLTAVLEAEAGGAGATVGQASEFQAQLAELDRTHKEARAQLDGRLAVLQAEADKAQAELPTVQGELERARPLAAARQGGRWWSLAWWKACLQGNVVERVEQAGSRLDELLSLITRLSGETTELQAERDRIENEYQGDRNRRREAQLAYRQGELDDQLAALAQEERLLVDKWYLACRDLSAGVTPPADMTAAGLETGRAAWRQLLCDDEQQVELARQWLGGIEEIRASFLERLHSYVNVVAATTYALPGDPHFGDRAHPTPFDLLLVEEADHANESEVLAAARRARRWVLLGEPLLETETGPASHRSASGSATQQSGSRLGFFHRLWKHLHNDPRQLPYTWVLRRGHLCCGLHPVPHGQERWVQSERLADRPDIELRILSVPRQQPLLVEVIFPPAVSMHEAKEYLFRELEELTIQAHGTSLRWQEKPGQVVLRLASVASPDARAVPLDPGVRELVGRLPGAQLGEKEGPAPWQTCRVEFDRAAGWDRRRAEQWVEQRLQLRNLGRTVLLGVPHRMQPALAGWLSETLYEGAYHCEELSECNSSAHPAVEFVAVPALNGPAESRRRGDEEGRRRGGGIATVAPRLRPVKGGAGLEMDLADVRRVVQLPAELRACLPGHGLINVPEAQAIVQTLETLAGDPAFQAAVAAWQRRHATVCDQANPRHAGRQHGHHPAVAVMALYPSQVELLRRLIQRAPLLASGPFDIQIGLPSLFRQRECLTALISLTRSHTHRAVTYGDHPRQLLQALTRARSRLFLFGDPGTLARRSQWQGPVDHLDEVTAGRERYLIGRLVGALHESGPTSQSFRLHEGGSV
jgi:hypothetical protein